MARFKQYIVDIDETQTPADVVAHRLYYREGSEPDYTSLYASFDMPQDKISIPDDIPNWPKGVQVYFGLTAVNSEGHESDMGIAPNPLSFTAPPVPVFTVYQAS